MESATQEGAAPPDPTPVADSGKCPGIAKIAFEQRELDLLKTAYRAFLGTRAISVSRVRSDLRSSLLRAIEKAFLRRGAASVHAIEWCAATFLDINQAHKKSLLRARR